AIKTRHWETDSEVDHDLSTRPKRKKKVRKRARRKKSSSSSCSCSSCSTSDNSNCSCCCCCTTSCSSLPCSSDSDERFAKYYELTSDEAEFRGVDFPAESRKDRRNMVKLLLHTMVMWDDIWRTRSPDEMSSASESDNSKAAGKANTSDSGLTSSEDEEHSDRFRHGVDYKQKMKDKRAGKEIKRNLNVEEQQEMAERGRLKQALEMTEDCGVFFSGRWYGQPLEEIDPFIFDDTFCVLGWRQQNTCIVYRYYKGCSIGYFAPDHPVRLFAFSVLTHRYFGRIIMFTILANCVTLALEKFEYDRHGTRVRNQLSYTITEALELTYLVIYTFEMFAKIIAKGFICQRMAYLRNGWNVLDFIVVLTSYLSYISELILTNDISNVGKLEFLRIFKVLRAVKTISILPGLRKIVNALINSAVQLCEVMCLTLFVVMIFALIGMEFFHGRFRNKCVRIQGETNDDGRIPKFQKITEGLSHYMTDWLYNMWVEDEHNWLYRDYPDSEPLPCGNSSTARSCEEGYVCLEVHNSKNPNNDWISFDNFLMAALQTMQVMTLDYWERTYEIAVSCVGKEAIVYFVFVIFIGGYYMLNLMLAVVTLCYEKEQKNPDVKTAKLTVQKRLELTRQMSNFHFEHLNHQRLRLFEGFRNRTARERDELLLRMLRAEEFAHPIMRDRFENSSQCVNAMYKLLQQDNRYQNLKVSQTKLQQLAMDNKYRQPLPEDNCYEEYNLYEAHSDAELVDNDDADCLELKNGKFCNFRLKGFDQAFIVQSKAKFITRPIKEKDFSLYPEQQKWESIKIWLAVWRGIMKPIVEDWKYGYLMTFCIFVNTVICCLEHHRQPRWLDVFIFRANDTFTYIFSFEVFLKAVAYQHHFFEYGWNKFDLFVAVGSLIDTQLQNQIGFKGIRALKLLRILKLAQAWDTMKILLNILIGAMGEMANLLTILFIAMYIFAVFGMQFLAGGYEPKNFRADFFPANYPRLAWQNSFASFIMVFRVFCGEWIVLTWECIEAHRVEKEEYKCFLMFIPTLVLGNFIILNLFVALLLHIFDSADEMTKNLKENRRGRARGFRRFWKGLKRRFSRTEGKEKVKKKKKPFSWVKKRNKVRPINVLENETTSQLQENEGLSNAETNSWTSIITTTLFADTFPVVHPISTTTSVHEIHVIPPDSTTTTADITTHDVPPILTTTSVDEALIVSPISNAATAETTPDVPPNLTITSVESTPVAPPVLSSTIADDHSKITTPTTAVSSVHKESPVSANNEVTPPEPEHRQLRIVLPYRLPKWRFYKVVLKYKEYEDGKIDHDSDVDDEDLMHTPQREAQNEKEGADEPIDKIIDFQENVDVASVGPENSTRSAAHSVASTFNDNRKRKFQISIFLQDIGEVDDVGEKIEEEEPLNPCFPPNWYAKHKCYTCWLEKTENNPSINYQRRRLLKLMSHSYYEWFMFVMIIVSSVLLCFDDIHLNSNPPLKYFLFYSGTVITIIFLIDFCLKVFAKGIYFCFTNGWMLLDFIVVVVGVFSLIMDLVIGLDTTSSSHYLTDLKVIRTLRALRPLRAISRYHGMRIVVNSLIQAIPAIFNVFCVCLVFWLVFAIMGVQFFKGRFFRCVNQLGEVLDHTVLIQKINQHVALVAPNKLVCCHKAKAYKFAWVNAFPNFDSVPRAYIALLYLATFEGWNEVIRIATDARDIDQQPVRDVDMAAEIYFISFAMFGGFLTTNLFVGVITDNFNTLKKKVMRGTMYFSLGFHNVNCLSKNFEGDLYEALMSPTQLRYYMSLKRLGRKQPRRVIPKPSSPARLAFFEIATSQRGEFIMFIVIFLNIAVMCFDRYGNSIMDDAILESLNAFFIYVYTFEALVKLIGLGTYYFKNGWNVFDFVILMISIVDYGVTDLITASFPVPPSMIRLLRIMRVGRMLRLMKAAKSIRRIVFSLLVSLPSLFNVGALMVLIIFIYSIIGMSVFGRIGYAGSIDEITNFETFTNAFFLLFRLTTLAGWDDILGSLVPTETECGDAPENDCGVPGKPECVSYIVGLIYIVSFIIITNYVIVNMFIAIILENFDQASKEDDLEITADDVDIFLSKWAIFDGDATQFMELKYLSPFLNSLEPPLRMKFPNQTAITALDIPIYRRGLVHVYDVLRNVLVFILGQAEAKQIEDIQAIINARFTGQFRQRRVLPIVSTTRIWKIQHNSATMLQRFWRNKVKRRKAAAAAAAMNVNNQNETLRKRSVNYPNKTKIVKHQAFDIGAE
ncbi:Sodium channel protein 60E, partial [Orchesella cincta]